MANSKPLAGNMRHGASQVAGNWVETFARFGYMTKGAVYVIVGGLAVMTTVGLAARPRGRAGLSRRSPRGHSGAFWSV